MDRINLRDWISGRGCGYWIEDDGSEIFINKGGGLFYTNHVNAGTVGEDTVWQDEPDEQATINDEDIRIAYQDALNQWCEEINTWCKAFREQVRSGGIKDTTRDSTISRYFTVYDMLMRTVIFDIPNPLQGRLREQIIALRKKVLELGL